VRRGVLDDEDDASDVLFVVSDSCSSADCRRFLLLLLFGGGSSEDNADGERLALLPKGRRRLSIKLFVLIIDVMTAGG